MENSPTRAARRANQRQARATRRFFGALSDAVRSVVAPAALVEGKAADTTAPDPADTYSTDEMPTVEEIEAAAREYDRASDMARRADRGRRAAKKILGRLPVGTYGTWAIERVVSNRETADLDEIRAIFKANDLGLVPMKRTAPSLKVRHNEVGPAVESRAAELVTA